MIVKTLKIVGFTLLFSSCSHKSVTQDVLTPDYLLSKGTQQLTFLGDNDHPRFSKDSSRIIFTSRARKYHHKYQVYEIEIQKLKERRVTFSDGDAFDAIYLGDDQIIYSSTTDEIKENPLLNKSFSPEAPPSELYMSDLYGNDIVRLTHNPGYDGQVIYLGDLKNPSLLFNGKRSDFFGIYRLDLKKNPINVVSLRKGSWKRFPAVSPLRSHLAWVDIDQSTKVQSLVSFKLQGKIPIVLKSGEGEYQDLFFAPRSPQRLFYSILRKGEKNHQLEVYNLETQCTQVVFKGTDSLFGPAVSNEENERLAFSRLFQDRKQIYLVKMPNDLGPCLEGTPQANLKE